MKTKWSPRNCQGTAEARTNTKHTNETQESIGQWFALLVLTEEGTGNRRRHQGDGSPTVDDTEDKETASGLELMLWVWPRRTRPFHHCRLENYHPYILLAPILTFFGRERGGQLEIFQDFKTLAPTSTTSRGEGGVMWGTNRESDRETA